MMKSETIALLFIIISVCLNYSCSKDDNEGNKDIDNLVLVKRVVSTRDGILNFTYNGNKLERISSDEGLYFRYMYTGELITRVEAFEKDGTSSGYYEILIYDNEKHIKTENYEGNIFIGSTHFVYNNDGTVDIVHYDENGSTGNTVWSKQYYDSEKHLVKNEQIFNNNVSATNFYTYDSKKNPYKNIIGYDKFNNIVNNILTEVTVSSYGEHQSIHTYTYNEKDYPITCKITSSSGSYNIDSIYYY